ncbi:MAG: hypothetical protein WCG23_10375 [bacterium]
MGSRTNQAIDSAIDKKLNKSFIIKSPRNELLKFANYCALKEYSAIDHASLISDLSSSNSFVAKRDDYDNEICDFLNYKIARTQSSFNILKLFKPGEILSTVISC